MNSKKDIKLNFRVDNAFYEMFQGKLLESNLSQSEFIREAITSTTVKQRCEGLNNLVWNINKIGINLNQISKHANENKLLDAAVLEEITQIHQQLATVIRKYS